MIRQFVLLTGMTAAVALARPALAQGPFADVPPQHWAKDAVNELAARGIVKGYPDGTFGGHRSINRYEFAAAIHRVLQNLGPVPLEHAPPAAPSAAPQSPAAPQEQLRNLPTREEMERLHADVDQLRRFMMQLQETMTVLRGEVDELKRQVGDVGGREPQTSSRSQPNRNGSPRR
jgi:hypothetical protein